jgi:exopolyphosphatase/guanosine-5'-triphosphate,3'-diphosphate pyrophosphatase
LTEQFVLTDPPDSRSVAALKGHVHRILGGALSDVLPVSPNARLVGTGGTVTTVAALAHGIDLEEVTPETMNGTTIGYGRLEALSAQMMSLNTEKRIERLGLDKGRADVMPAGTIVVMQIMTFFDKDEMTVCLSDILEGLQIEYLEKE